MNYTLVATLPAHMLGACGSVLPRPSWESWMYHIVNVFMAIVLVIVLVSAFMDSDRIVRSGHYVTLFHHVVPRVLLGVTALSEFVL